MNCRGVVKVQMQVTKKGQNMKNLWWLSILLSVVMCLVGCTAIKDAARSVTEEKVRDAIMAHLDQAEVAAYAGATAIIDRANVSNDALWKLHTFTEIATQLLQDPDNPNLDAVRAKAKEMLPPQLSIVGDLVVGLVEPYVDAAAAKRTDRVKVYQQGVAAIMNGIDNAALHKLGIPTTLPAE